MTLDDVLHPPIEALRTGRLNVSPLHEIYWETVGNPQGTLETLPRDISHIAEVHFRLCDVQRGVRGKNHGLSQSSGVETER